MWLVRTSISRPVMAIMLIASLMMLGYISLGRLGVDLFPKIEFPYVVVQTTLEGASPEVIETEVTDPLEEEINSTAGIESLTSISKEGYSQVRVEFNLDADPDVKSQEVRNKVDQALRQMPTDAELPTVQKMDPDADPVITVMVSGDLPIGALTEYADKVLKERLQRIAGVGGVQIVGGRLREIRIWLDSYKLRAYGVTVQQVIDSIQKQHAEIPGGRLETQGGRRELTVKTKGEITDFEKFGDIVVSQRALGPVFVRDVARIEDGLEDERSYAELNGGRGVALEIRRQSGKNTVEVVNNINDALAELRTSAPAGVEIVTAKDVARFVESSIADVKVDLSLAIVLVVIVTMVFLMNARATVIVATAIPSALLSTFFAFYLLDFTVNMLTMMALSVAIGLLVDDAIVVLESIYSQMEDGVAPMEAAFKGTEKVFGAVIAGTLSIMAVFVPIAFMEGIVGRFFYQYGLTIVFSVGISLLVSLTLTPMLCSRMLSVQKPTGLFRIINIGHQHLESGYAWLLNKSLHRIWLVFTIAFLAIYMGVQFARQVPLAFSAKTDRSEFTASIELPLGTGVAETKEIGRRVAAQISRVEFVELVFMSIGSGADSQPNKVNFYIGILHKSKRDKNFQLVMDEIREMLKTEVPEARSSQMAEISWVSAGSGGAFSNDIYVIVQGSELDTLESITAEITNRMKKGSFRDISTSYEAGKPELHVEIDRERAADLGVSVRDVANVVRASVGGMDVTSFQEKGTRYDVRLRLEEGNRDQVEKLDLIQVTSGDGQLIDLASIVSFNLAQGPLQIDRLNRARQIGVFANAPPQVAVGTVKAEMDEILSTTEFPDGYSFKYEGQSEQIMKSAQAIGFAFVLAIVALYIILSSQFNSFGQPLVIMVTAPLSFVGAFALLYFLDGELSLFAQIGLIALMGLVMKNGILIVDFANQNLAKGLPVREAIEDAARERLRPVLMTACSTIFGMLPVAFSTSDGAEFRTALGMIIIGGMTSSTFLTLLVVPAAYIQYHKILGLPGFVISSISKQPPQPHTGDS